MSLSFTLTGNERLARYLQKKNDAYQLSVKKHVWQASNILSLASWLQQTWQELQIKGLVPPKVLLTEHQSDFLWLKILKQDQENNLLNIRQTVTRIKQAWHLLQIYQISIHDPLLQYHDASKKFQEWGILFQQTCIQNHFLDKTELLAEIARLISQSLIKLPDEIILIGFLEITPELTLLIKAIEYQKTKVTIIKEQYQKTNKAYQYGFNSKEQEMRSMAQFAKKITEENKAATICFIVQHLNSLRTSLHRHFKQLFAEVEFNISSGSSLAEEPIISIIFTILKLKNKEIPLEEIGYLLRSPFVDGAIHEYYDRALLDEELRKLGVIKLTLEKFIQQSDSCPRLKKCLIQLKNISIPQNQSPTQWAAIFSNILFAMEFPGERTLNSREYQTIQHWKSLLTHFSNLSFICPTLNYHEAFSELSHMAHETIFQTQTKEANIQILGLLEVTGMHFDYCWMMEADDLNWPASAHPNPFIPHFLQRKYNMPHANAERESAFANIIMDELLTSADTIIFSYAAQDKDLSLSPSALIKNLEHIDTSPLFFHFSPCGKDSPPKFLAKGDEREVKYLEKVLDTHGPNFTEMTEIAGGTKLFKLQAACPFQAFATLRLQAIPLKEPVLGLTEAERGIALHRVLESFWNITQNHTNLCAMKDYLLKKNITDLTKSILKEMNVQKNLPQYFYVIETERLVGMILQWLMIEKKRLPFQVISQERRQTTTLGKIMFHLQIDRIDQLQDGSYVIIDYKTGLTALSQWLGDRPDEPQLPLYAILNKDKLSGVYFAQIRTKQDDYLFKGISNNKEYLLEEKSKVFNQSEWENQLISWQTILNKLSDDFASGLATVDPKNGAQTCQYCYLQSFCRIKEKE